VLSVKENNMIVLDLIHMFARHGKFAIASFSVQLIQESVKQEFTLITKWVIVNVILIILLATSY